MVQYNLHHSSIGLKFRMSELKQNYLGQNLIFIISQPRSGSTLLQRILFGHPKIQTSAETWLMLHPCYAFKKKGINTEYNSHFAATGTKEFIENYTDGFEVYDDAIRQWANVIYSNAIKKHNKDLRSKSTTKTIFWTRRRGIFLLLKIYIVFSQKQNSSFS